MGSNMQNAVQIVIDFTLILLWIYNGFVVVGGDGATLKWRLIVLVAQAHQFLARTNFSLSHHAAQIRFISLNN